eukprot:g29087.t1
MQHLGTLQVVIPLIDPEAYGSNSADKVISTRACLVSSRLLGAFPDGLSLDQEAELLFRLSQILTKVSIPEIQADVAQFSSVEKTPTLEAMDPPLRVLVTLLTKAPGALDRFVSGTSLKTGDCSISFSGLMGKVFEFIRVLQPASHEELVEKIKALQRSDPTSKQTWWDYCDQHLGGMKDPKRHDENTLADFLAIFESGGITPPPRPAVPSRPIVASRPIPSGRPSPRFAEAARPPFMAAPPAAISLQPAPPLAECVKMGQRSSIQWKNAWQAYCQLYGGGFNDPAKHDDAFIKSFLEYVGEVALISLANMESEERPQRKRPLSGAVFAQAPPAKRQTIFQDDSAEKTALVEKIKALQRSSFESKQAWWAFCDAEARGIKDPNRHQVEKLQQFLDEFGG